MKKNSILITYLTWVLIGIYFAITPWCVNNIGASLYILQYVSTFCLGVLTCSCFLILHNTQFTHHKSGNSTQVQSFELAAIKALYVLTLISVACCQISFFVNISTLSEFTYGFKVEHSLVVARYMLEFILSATALLASSFVSGRTESTSYV